MKASDTNVLQFIGSNSYKVFIIPPFQRNYEWTTETDPIGESGNKISNRPSGEFE